MPHTWHNNAMSRIRVSTTVDEERLASARRTRPGATDAVLLDEALEALILRHRGAEINASYAAYDEHPLDEVDEWGDLASFREAAATLVSPVPARGEVWWCELADAGRRPVVVLSWDAAIPKLRRALIAPCTTTIRGLASEVVLEPSEDPVPRRSGVNLDSVESVSLGVLVERLGRLSDERMRQVCAALEVAVDCLGS